MCAGCVCERGSGRRDERCDGSDDHVPGVARQTLDDDEEQSPAAGALQSHAPQVSAACFTDSWEGSWHKGRNAPLPQ